MKTVKKLLAVVLSALMLAAALPTVAASAQELVDENGVIYTVTEDEACVVGCESDVVDLIIPTEFSGLPVKKIAEEAFENNIALKTVTFYDGVKVINDSAFKGCTGIEEIVIPDSVTRINGAAFADCTSLKDVSLSENLTYLGASAFKSTAIEAIEIPKSLNSGDRETFTASYSFNDSTYGLTKGPFVLCESLKTVTFEDGTDKIPTYLFAGCVGLESIVIPNGVTVIEEGAFLDCLRLSSVEMPDTVNEIRTKAFKNTVSLEGVKLSNSLVFLGSESFGCSALKEIEIPRSMDKAEIGVFQYTYKLDSKEYSIEKGPFVLCNNLNKISFQKGATQVAENLFSGAIALEQVTIPDTVTTVEEGAFEGCLRLSKVDIPDTCTVIGSSAFANCASLKSVELPENLKELGSRAFAYSALESVKIPKYLEKANEEVFQDNYTFNGKTYSLERGPFVLCKNLKTVTFEKGITAIAQCVLAGAVAVEEITVPESVKEIEFHAFTGCVNLKNINLSETVEVIGEGAFSICVSLTDLTVPASVTSVNKYAFNGCEDLVGVEFKNSETAIADYVFSNCTALKSVKLPEGLTELSSGVFYNCTAIEEIELPEALTVVGASAFENAASLKNIVIPENVSTIKAKAFKNCTSLESVNVPQSVKSLGESVFENCESLSAVDFADYSIKTLNNSTFKNCYRLEAIKLPKGLKTVGEQAFMNCIVLFDVIIPESVTEISDNAFSYPAKTTIYSRSGSYVEEFAQNGGFKFENNITDAESIKLKNGADKMILEENTTYRLEFELEPVDANETVTLVSADKGVVSVNGMDITTSHWHESVELTASTASGASFTFEVIVRGITGISIVEGTYREKYAPGEEFDAQGIKAQAKYSDGTVVEIENLVFSGFDSSKAGETTVKATWIAPNGNEYSTKFTVEILAEGENLPEYTVLKDEKTSIVVEAYTDADLSVVEITDGIKINEVNILLADEAVQRLFDITLTDNGVAVQPDGTVKVKIPVDSENAKIYRVEEDSTLTDMQAVYEDGFMVFTTEHFSLYVLTGVKAESEYQPGDANKDSKLNIRDATAIQKYVAKLVEFDEEALALADFDQNGKVNVKDATAIQKKLAGII